MSKPVPHLLVWLIDDDEDDHFFIRRVVERAEALVILKCFATAMDAMRELSQPQCPTPDLIICDLKMPALSGDAFVRWLRGTRHHLTPVVVRSTSELERDIMAAYESGANAFVRKGMDLTGIDDNVRHIVRFGMMLKEARAGTT